MSLIDRWQRAVNDRYPDISFLKKSIWRGTATKPPRSLLWKVLLLYETFDTHSWSSQQDQHYSRCTGLCETYSRAIAELDDLIETAENIGSNGRSSVDGLVASLSSQSDPLSSTTDLYMNDATEEADLKDTILRDIERTFPDEPFFRERANQKTLAAILYIYARLYPDIGYRQGMHELAGPILWVVSQDALLDATFEKYIQSDTLALFEAIMRSARPWYLPGHPPAIVGKCVYIQNHILRQVDPQLYRILVSNNIEPQIWGIRWIRLIFGREFGFEGLLHMWDALFAADPSLDLVDHICVVILLSLRQKIVESPHYSDILTLLLSSPLPFELADLETSKYVARALYIKEHPTVEGGSFVAAQFASNGTDVISIDPLNRTRSPNILNFDSVREAAKSVDKKFRGALENTPKLSSLSPQRSKRDSTSSECNHKTRNASIAQLLTSVMQDVDLPDGAAAKLSHIHACLLDDTIAVESTAATASQSTPELGSSTDTMAPRSAPVRNRSSLLGKTEFSWMLDSLDSKTSGFRKSKNAN